MNIEKIYRLKYIYELIKNQPGISKNEILNRVNEHLFQFWDSQKETLSFATFKRDRNEVEELFNVTIVYKNGYYIEENTYIQNSSALLETIALYLLSTKKPNSLKYIRFAPRKKWDANYYFDILKAIENKKKIIFTYLHHEKKEITQRLISPLGLKEFKGFWYLVCLDGDQVKTFGLDRISDLTESKENAVIPKDFDLDDHFKHCFGIVRFPNTEPEEVIVKMLPVKYAYYKENPLHSSQKVVEEKEEYVVISLYVYFTYDLKQELRSHAKGEVKVLQPKVDLHSDNEAGYYFDKDIHF